jgi:Iron/manganese superoxide dismutases, alpha-hairpin domain
MNPDNRKNSILSRETKAVELLYNTRTSTHNTTQSMALLSSIAVSSKITRPQLARGLTTAMLPPLPYEYNALEPVISGETMWFHHQKHHQTYVTNYNAALELLDSAMEKGDASAVVGLSAIKFNGGGLLRSLSFFSPPLNS